MLRKQGKRLTKEGKRIMKQVCKQDRTLTQQLSKITQHGLEEKIS